MSDIRKILRQKSIDFEKAAETTNDKFNKGYFEGKAEAFKLAETAMSFTSKEDIIDALNGDI